MKESLYNVVKTNGTEVWVYNTLTSAFVKMEASIWNYLWSEDAEEYRKMLYKQGILIDDHSEELIKYKYKYYGTAF